MWPLWWAWGDPLKNFSTKFFDYASSSSIGWERASRCGASRKRPRKFSRLQSVGWWKVSRWKQTFLFLDKALDRVYFQPFNFRLLRICEMFLRRTPRIDKLSEQILLSPHSISTNIIFSALMIKNSWQAAEIQAQSTFRRKELIYSPNRPSLVPRKFDF